jgi:hypothetical protein
MIHIMPSAQPPRRHLHPKLSAIREAVAFGKAVHDIHGRLRLSAAELVDRAGMAQTGG